MHSIGKMNRSPGGGEPVSQGFKRENQARPLPTKMIRYSQLRVDRISASPISQPQQRRLIGKENPVNDINDSIGRRDGRNNIRSIHLDVISCLGDSHILAVHLIECYPARYHGFANHPYIHMVLENVLQLQFVLRFDEIFDRSFRELSECCVRGREDSKGSGIGEGINIIGSFERRNEGLMII